MENKIAVIYKSKYGATKALCRMDSFKIRCRLI